MLIIKENTYMYWVDIPKKVYFKSGSVSVALKELSQVYGFKRALIVSDASLVKQGLLAKVDDLVSDQGIRTSNFFTIDKVPTFENIRSARTKVTQFEPDVIIGLGGNAVMSAAKLIWVMNEDPDIDFNSLADKFDKVESNVSEFPVSCKKSKLILIPTTAGSGAECSPYAIVADDEGKKRVIASFGLLPEMAVVDGNFSRDLPIDITKTSALNALSHAVRAYISPNCSDFVKGWAASSVKSILTNLPEAIECGSDAVEARQNLANAAALAGMAIGNAVYTVDPDIVTYPTTRDKKPGKKASEELVKLAKLIGIEGSDDKELIDNFISECEKLQEL